MLDGFQYVLAQIGVVVAITALLAGVLGWLVGHGSRRRTEKAFERAVAAIARPESETSPFAPTPSPEDVVDQREALAARTDPEDHPPAEVDPLALGPGQPYGVQLIQHAPLHVSDDPDATVIRPAPGPMTTPYAPPAVISSVPAGPGGVPDRVSTTAQAPTSEDVLQLRQELRDRDLELGRIEAGALSAWDRVVPRLEEQIAALTSEIDALARRARAAEERLDADALLVDHLRALVASRDTTIAELRAQS